MAATFTHAIQSEVTSNGTSYGSGSFTPAAGDLLVVLVVASDTTAAGSVSNSEGLTFTKVASALKNSSLDTCYVFVADSFSNGNSQTCTFDCTGDAATGCALSVLRIAGMLRAGASAVRQSAKSENQAAGTPAVTMAAAMLTGNPSVVLMGNSTNVAGMTPPTGWTEQRDNGYNTPTTGYEYGTRINLFSGTTVTWGSSSASAFGAIVVEFDLGPVGTLSTTFDALTLASTGTLALSGSLGQSLGALAASATGVLPINGTLSQTLGELTLSATGSLPIAGALSQSLDALTLSSQGALALAGSLDATLGALTASGAGQLPVGGSTGAALDPLTLSATGSLGVLGSVSATLGDLTLESTATLVAQDIQDDSGGGDTQDTEDEDDEELVQIAIALICTGALEQWAV